MFKVEILDMDKKVLMLKWIGVVDTATVEEATVAMNDAIKKMGEPYNFLVDTRELKLNKSEEAFIEQQKLFLPRITKIAVVFQSSITKLQIRKMAQGSQNSKENFFNDFDEALEFLKK